jgi:UDP-N-acetylmuramoylalanine--D-glutamate ligase
MEEVSQLEFNENSMEKTNLKSIVLGGGISGKAAFDLLVRLGETPILVDAKDPQGVADTEEKARELLIPEATKSIIKSPGISPKHPWLVLARERGILIQSEIDLARSCFSGKIIGITGTDGKSTTTALTHHLTLIDYPKAQLGGNIGRAFSEFADKDYKLAVVELSSYQLEDSLPLDLDSSAILNLAPDHLERHGSMENYAFAKRRIIKENDPQHIFVSKLETIYKINLKLDQLNCEVKLFGTDPKHDAFIDIENLLIQTKQASYSIQKFSLEGFHNLENLAASILLAESIEIPSAHIQTQIETFQGLAHRFEKFMRSFGWTFVNDSKSTNVHSLMAWLQNFESQTTNLILLMGGRTKSEDMTPVVACLKNLPCQVYVYGEARTHWRKDFNLIREKVNFVESMEEALVSVKNIWSKTKQENTWVVLSPACASFDQFKNFEDRGLHFKELSQILFSAVE